MTEIWTLAALWLGLALIASLLSIWLRMATAMSEIIVGTIAQLIIGVVIGTGTLGGDQTWIKFLSGTRAIVLTFLAGAELDPTIFRTTSKETIAIGLAGFIAPFLGCAAAAYYVLGWSLMPSWLAGVALSTTSVAVVYVVMMEFGFNVIPYGKKVLAACFINDLTTVIALGLIFAPFSYKTLIFVVASVIVFILAHNGFRGGASRRLISAPSRLFPRARTL
jgi:glutathione-regulated potassium-efflux system ancillary protein KefC